MNTPEPFITNDAIVFGLLMTILMIIFQTSNSSKSVFVKFYKYVPALLLCYFIPSIFNSMGIIDGEQSNLYFVASRYLLPASLALLTLSVDLKEIKKLGFKAIIMFLAGTVGIIIGGPLAILVASIVAPDVVGREQGQMQFGVVWLPLPAAGLVEEQIKLLCMRCLNQATTFTQPR